ncbi:hypothetical protein [Nocardia terpenica]|uniref:Uncharacterized protein n=1 Tax=Nocardia terpenica TaxID=455432 RepID=A0A6G9Z106_9NOCA|nr:hypothetical protein [Nocardia terpenica]QIS18906.1 hypothetical protein F6W96_11980 [Nocardia terpenica]
MPEPEYRSTAQWPEAQERPLLPNASDVLNAVSGTTDGDLILELVEKMFEPHRDRYICLERLQHLRYPAVPPTADRIRANAHRLATTTIVLIGLTHEITREAARRVHAHIRPALGHVLTLDHEYGDAAAGLVFHVMLAHAKTAAGHTEAECQQDVIRAARHYTMLQSGLLRGHLTLRLQE